MATTDATQSMVESISPKDGSLDRIFDALKNPRRRELVAYLHDREPEVTLTRLANHVASIETGVPVGELSTRQKKTAYVSLYQCHVPKLEELGVVEHDSTDGVVRATGEVDRYYTYLTAERPGRLRSVLRLIDPRY